ncbi:MAG TPA: TonB-dependent receptor [Gemmatimonadaceae bacterium]|nr:TonB-dependent receptor [Gemmatimonadaceae bacterium]
MNVTAFSATAAVLILAVAAQPAAGAANDLSAPTSSRMPGAPENGIVSGTVTDQRGTALAGATVTIPELNRTVISSRNGAFTFADVPKGKYTIVVRSIGYQSYIEEITVDGPTTVKAALSSSGVRLPDVVVSASRSPLSAFLTPLPVSAPTSETLRREHSVSIAHTIDGLPGVHSLTTGGQIGKPVIRGFGGSRVLVLQDGMRLEDYSWSDEDGPSVDARLADRIEVIRGPASLLFGSDAMGGVVNVIPAPLPESGPRRGSAEVYFGSNSREFGGVLSAEGVRGNMGWRLTGIGRKSEALHTPTGELENTGFFAGNGQAAVGWHGPWGSLTARFDQYGGEFKLLEANGPPPGVEEGEEGGPERKLADERVQVTGSFPMKHFRLEPKVQWQRHTLAEMADAAEVGGSGLIETKVFDLALNTFSSDVLAHIDIGDAARTTLGVSGIYQKNDSRAPAPGLPFVPDATISTMSAFGIGQVKAGRLSLLGGGRVDHRSLSADATPALSLAAQDLSNSAVSGNVGATLELALNTALTVNVGRAWRAPNLFELYANGPLLAEGRWVFGKSTLEPEFGTNIDGGFKWSSSKARLELSAYRNRVTDYVFLNPTNEKMPQPGSTTDSLRVFRYDATTAVLNGAEVGAELDAMPFLSLRARYDFVRGKDDDTGDNLPLMPPSRMDVEAELHSTHFRSWGHSFVSVGVEHEAAPSHLSPLEAEENLGTTAYTLVNVGAGFEPRIAGGAWRIDLRVRNLANTEYRNFLSRYKEFALNPGRDIVLRARIGY